MKRIEFYFLIFIIFIFSCKKDDRYTNSFKTTINVPDEIASIQEAIDKANDFDTILVSKGQYNENINFNGKRIYLTSLYYRTLDTLDIVNTVLKGEKNSVVRFQNHEDTTAVLDGFTLTGGSPVIFSLLQGGGIYIKAANPTLKNLIIEHNSMFQPNEQGLGGGIYCDSGSIKATNLKIRNNICGGSYGGGGIYATNSNVILDNCEIINNSTAMNIYCGGLYFSNINFLIENSKIENNPNPQISFPAFPDPHPIAIGIYNSVGSFVNTIINDRITFMNSNIKFNNCIINEVIYP
jgi:hypothetical protein